MTGKRVLITGANGFLGRHIVEKFQNVFRVNILVRNRNYIKENIFYFENEISSLFCL